MEYKQAKVKCSAIPASTLSVHAEHYLHRHTGVIGNYVPPVKCPPVQFFLGNTVRGDTLY